MEAAPRHRELPSRPFAVQLDVFRGPLDLLWYLVRKNELEVTGLNLAQLTEQFLTYLSVIEQLDLNLAGEFVEVASQLLEMKSRLVLPQSTEPEPEELVAEPNEILVARLLEYKKYRDVACLIEERGRIWQMTYARMALDVPPRTIDPSQQPIREVELWDLVSAFGRVMRDLELKQESTIVYDDTPIQTYVRLIHERLCRDGSAAMTDVLQGGMTKASVIGLFLAVLELVRHHSVEAEQDEGSIEIWLRPGPTFRDMLELEIAL